MSDVLLEMLRWTHLSCGIAALGAFWIPAAARKGGRVHRTAGKVFLMTMLVVIITGVPLAARFLWQGQWVNAVFLLYLAVITGGSLGTAWFSLRFKREPARYFGGGYLATALLTFASGIAVMTLGWLHDVTLLFFFGMIGPFAGLGMLKKWRATMRGASWWLHEHLGGMIGAGIAAHVAFGAFGLRRLWPAYASVDGVVGMLPWFGPVVVGIAASAWLERKYANGLPRNAVIVQPS